MFYDQKGVTPFLQLPKYSFFGDYQILFDLRANYSIKVTGKEEYGPDTVFSKQEKTFCLCVNKDIFEHLCTQYPKSKYMIQQRALERRRVFMEEYQKLESYLSKKKQIIADYTKQKYGTNKNIRLHTEDDTTPNANDGSGGRRKGQEGMVDFDEDDGFSSDESYKISSGESTIQKEDTIKINEVQDMKYDKNMQNLLDFR